MPFFSTKFISTDAGTQAVYDATKRGASAEEAKNKAFVETYIYSALEAFGAGALGGVISGSGATIIGGVRGRTKKINNKQPLIDLPTAEDVQKAMDSGEKTGIEFEKDYEEYPYNMKTAIKEYVEYSNPMIRGFVEKVMGGSTKPKDKIYLNNVRERVVNDIKDILGVDVTGYKVALDENTVKHIAKRHGKNGKADSSMANLSDWEKIQYVLENYDNIEYGGTSRGYTTIKENGAPKLAETVKYSKKINGTYYVVEAVPVTNAKTLNVVTAYINKKGAMQVSDVKNPKETSETPSAYTPSTDNIPQPNGIVNNTLPFKVVLTPNIPMHLVDSVNAINKKTGIDVVFGTAYNADGSINTKYRGEIGNNRIVVSENATKASVYRSVILHELTHGIEGTSLYNDIKNYVINKKYGVNQEQLRADISAKIQQYKNNGVDLTQNGLDAEKGAMTEIVAENVEEYIFAEDVKSIVERDYTFGQKIYDLISELIYNFKKKYKLNVDELASAQRKYRLALDEVKRKGIKSDGGYSIFNSFYSEYDKWIAKGASYDTTLEVGRTSEALKSIGIEDKKIKWDTKKIKKIKTEHNLNDKIIKQVPEIIENPVIVMDSLQKQSRLTILGEVYDLNNKPVLAVLELEPTNRKGEIVLDEIKIASAYGKDNVQNLINNSNILYVDKNKKRINNWLTLNRLQLPLGQTNYQFSNDIVSQSKTNVNNKYMQNTKNNSASTEKTEMQLAFERAKAKKQYSFVTEEDTETGKFTDKSETEYTRVDDTDDSFGVRILEGKDESGKDVLKIDIDNPDLDNVVNSEEYKRVIENAYAIKEVSGNTLTAERAFEKAFGKNYEDFRKVVYDNLDKSKLQYMKVLDYLTKGLQENVIKRGIKKGSKDSELLQKYGG